MRTGTESRHQTKVGANMLRDLGFSSTVAKRLLAHADAHIDESIRLKQQLMTRLLKDHILAWIDKLQPAG